MAARRDTHVTPVTPKKRALFLAALAACGNVTRAAEAARISRQSAHRLRCADPDFANAWEKAINDAAPVLEEEAWRRAHDGTPEPLTSAKGLIYDADGQPVTVQKYSDTLLIFLLKGMRPAKYRDNVKISGTVEHSLVPHGAAAALADDLLTALGDMPDARAALAARLLTAGEVAS